MYRIAAFLSALLVTSIACGLFNSTPLPESANVGTVVAETMQAIPSTDSTASENFPPQTSEAIAFSEGSLALPTGLAATINETFVSPANEPDVPPWEITPGHVELRLSDYVLGGTFHTPTIYVYPAQSSPLPPGAAENIELVRDITANPGQLSGSNNMPTIPFFNAGPIFIAQENLVEFQNGAGVRMITQYAQSIVKVNNNELFYHFQGLTADNQFYLIAILPVNAPTLAPDSSETSAIPAGGVSFPGYADIDADFQGYYEAVTGNLNSLPEEDFTPSLSTLDALIASIQVSSP
jgi:hypothetical protein